MTSNVENLNTLNQDNKSVAQGAANDKELNFRALEAKYQRELEKERSARLEAERIAQEERQRISQKRDIDEDDDDDNEPYVDHKKLNKKLSSFEKKFEEKIDRRAEEKARGMIEKEKRESWLQRNPDFYDVMGHAQQFYERDPELAETILKMPDTFERQQLVYKNIKALGVHKPVEKGPSIQEKIDANKRSPYYQPSGVGTAPYAQAGDFSKVGQKNAYDKMQELKQKLRI